MGAAIQKGRFKKREGRSFAIDDFVADDRDLQADLLVQILPDHCLQKLLGLPSGASEQPNEGKRTQHGATVGHCAWRGLSFGERQLYLPWDMSNVDIETGVKGRRPDPPVPAEPVTMWMIEQLEVFIADPATPLVAKHLAAAYLFCYYAVMRVEQAQSCWIDAIRDDEFIQGYVFLDKNPKRDKMQPRP